MQIKINLNENLKSVEESMELLARMYLEIKKTHEEYVKLKNDDAKRQFKKNGKKIENCASKIFELKKKSCVVAAGFPAIVSNDDFQLLHGCEVEIKDNHLRYEIVQEIYHNLGNGNVERAIKLFMPEYGTGYDDKLSWHDNVQRVIENHTESESIVGKFFSSKPEMAAAERFLIKSCEIIKDVDPATIQARTVKTESVIELAEKMVPSKPAEINVIKRADSVRDQILANQRKK